LLSSDDGRLRLFQAVREYGAARLDDPGAEVRHGEFYARAGDAALVDALSRRGGMARRQALRVDLDNFVVANERAVSRGDGPVALGACRAAWAVVVLVGPFSLGARLADAVLEVMPRSPEAHVVAGQAKRLLGLPDEARAHFEAALEVHRAAGDQKGVARVLNNLGAVANHAGRIPEARVFFAEALELARESRDRPSEAAALGNLATMARVAQGFESAIEQFEVALALHREVGNRRGEGIVLGNLGAVHRQEGRMELASTYFQAALRIHHETHDLQMQAMMHSYLGNMEMTLGHDAAAKQHYAAGVVVARKLGDRRVEAGLLLYQGVLANRMDDPAGARILLEDAIGCARAIDNLRLLGGALGELGAVLLALGREEAVEVLEEAMAISGESDDKGAVAMASGRLGMSHRSRGDHAAARSAFETAQRMGREGGDRRECLWTAVLAVMDAEAGAFERARAGAAEAGPLADEHLEYVDRIRVHCWLMDAALAMGDRGAALAALEHAERIGASFVAAGGRRPDQLDIARADLTRI
jgi:tetratricopeptide (TPR) repeat protein